MSPSRYQHPLTHYAKEYGVSYKAIQRWARKGYPLDDEAATRAPVASQCTASANVAPPLHTTGDSAPQNASAGLVAR